MLACEIFAAIAPKGSCGDLSQGGRASDIVHREVKPGRYSTKRQGVEVI